MWIIELAIKTIIAETRIGIHNDIIVTILFCFKVKKRGNITPYYKKHQIQ